jgi:hypothetical protein
MSAFDALKNEHSHVRVTAVSVIAGFSKQRKISILIHMPALILTLQPTSS